MSSAPQDQKKLRESRIVAGFQRATGLEFRVLDDSREAPDFLLRFEGRVIGLEVTELFVAETNGGMALQARTSIGRRIAQGAWKRYVELGGKPVHVSVHFSPSDSLRDLNRDAAIEQLARLVVALDPPLGGSIEWRQRYPYSDLPLEIFALHILAVSSWDQALWTVPEAGWVAPLTAEVFQAAIDEKTANLERYKQVTPEVWILMATTGMSASQLFEMPRDFKPDSIQSPFDRTYYFAGFEGRAFRLGVA